VKGLKPSQVAAYERGIARFGWCPPEWRQLYALVAMRGRLAEHFDDIAERFDRSPFGLADEYDEITNRIGHVSVRIEDTLEIARELRCWYNRGPNCGDCGGCDLREVQGDTERVYQHPKPPRTRRDIRNNNPIGVPLDRVRRVGLIWAANRRSRT